MSDPRVSIVIPTYQRRELVHRLLTILCRQTLPQGFYEVVVAIDGSQDGTREMVANFPAPYRLVSIWQSQRGRAAACNTGVRASSSEMIVLLDDDMEPVPEFVAAHLAAHPPGTHRGVVGAAPILTRADSLPVVHYRSGVFGRKIERLTRSPHNLLFNDVYTGNFSIRRELFLGVGGFDEEFRLYGHEDYEMVLRLTELGTQFVFDPAALAWQNYGKSFRSLADNVLGEGQTAVLFARKHPRIVGDLYLGQFASLPRRRRRQISALLTLTRLWNGVPELVIRAAELAEWCRARKLHQLYDFVFDYLYWLGVERALRADGASGGRIDFCEIERWTGEVVDSSRPAE